MAIGSFAAVCLSLVLCCRRYGKEIGLTPEQLQIMLGFLTAGVLLFTSAFCGSHIDESALEEDRAAPLTGTVLSCTKREDRTELILVCELPSGKRKVLCRDYRETRLEAEPGEILILNGELRLPSARRNPACFDYRKYLKSRGISYLLTVKGVNREGKNNGIPMRFRRWIRRKRIGFLQLFDDTGAEGLLRGAVFGDRSGLAEETSREFTGNGTAHILAVSGLHVGFLLSLLQQLMKGARAGTASAIAAVVLFCYGEITAWNVPTVRAVLIALTALCGHHLRRPFDLTSAAAAAAILQLAAQPYLLFQAGFLMSYLAIFGLAWLSGPVSHAVGKAAAGLVALQAAVIPYMVTMFNHWNPFSVLINLPVVFLASVMIPAAVLGFAAYLLCGTLPVVVTDWISALFRAEEALNHLLYADGRFDHLVPSVDTGLLLTGMVLLFAAGSEMTRILILRRNGRTAAITALVLMIPVVIYGACMRNPFLDDSVVFLDVGQGDGIHLRAGENNVLIDGGGSLQYSVGEQVLEPYLLHNGIGALDLSLLTHLHLDHCQGVTELAEEYPVRSSMVPAVYRGTEVCPKGAAFYQPGDIIRLSDDVWIEVLWPFPDSGIDPEEADENEINGVFMAHVQDIRILITGDLLEQGELDMLQYYEGTDKLDCDVLKVAHHGSRYSSCDAFLDTVTPRAAVIQVGENNFYGHPAADTRARLEERGIPVYRTDLGGAIGLEIHGRRMKIDRMIG
ncbi:MAG: ComEC/Rec2 family competence protein, partial [Mogibacterium sp.]|nr:ComEC/Rec2 family competence protein [Mogibacterium sp.]